MESGETTSHDVNMSDAAAVASLFHAAANAMCASPLRRGSAVHIKPERGSSARLLATGDLHDNLDHLRKIIALARLDESPDHHVVLHEIIHGERLINGMDFSYRMLARVAALVVRWPSQVHPILANHELSQLTGKGVSKGAGNSVELFNEALEYVFGDEWSEVSNAIREFIGAMPLAACGVVPPADGASAPGRKRCAGVFCSHSLPDERAMRWFDPDILDRELTAEDFSASRGSAYAMVWGRRHSDEQIEALAQRWGVKLFILGHRHVETGIEPFGSRVIVLNSDHERATVLPIDLAHIPSADEAVLAAVPLLSVE